MISYIPILPLIAFLINGLFGKRYLKDNAQWISTATIAVSFLLSVLTLFKLMANDYVPLTAQWYDWVVFGSYQVEIALSVDALTATMLLIVTGISLLVHIYTIGYLHGDKGLYRFYAYLSLFTFAMLMLIMGDNYLMLFFGWEGVGVCSYLLIGFWYHKKSATTAGIKAFIANRVGDFGLMLGIMTLYTIYGSFKYDVILTDPQRLLDATFTIFGMTLTGGVLATMVALLLMVGALGKSAQLPLYVWLPDAMEGPTSCSALIHAATMVTAGVYLICRSHVLYMLSPTAMMVVATIGCATAFFAASIALVQNDVKRVLAYSTISQLGYMIMAVGIGAYQAAVFHLMTHAFFKALLFLGAGSVIHGMSGEQDMRKMGGLHKHMKWTSLTCLAGVVAIAGLPPFAGFFSKDQIIGEAFKGGAYYPLFYVLWFFGMVTALMTAFYMSRWYIMTFLGKERIDDHAKHHLHESPNVMIRPLQILAVLSLGAGLFFGWPLEKGYFHDFIGNTLPRHHPVLVKMKESTERNKLEDAKKHAVAKINENEKLASAGSLFGLVSPAYAGSTHESTSADTAKSGSHGATESHDGEAKSESHDGGAKAESHDNNGGGEHESATAASHESSAGAGGEHGGGGGGGGEHGLTAVDFFLIFFSIFIACLGVWLAYIFYLKKVDENIPDKIAKKFPNAYNTLLNKYYVDEGYQIAFIDASVNTGRKMWEFDVKVIDGAVNGLASGSRSLSGFLHKYVDVAIIDFFVNFVAKISVDGSNVLYDFFDVPVIDGVVNGFASITQFIGNHTRKIQTGQVQTYIFVFVTGLLVLLSVFVIAVLT